MQINTTDFNVKKEMLFDGTIKYICTPKERKCDHCGDLKRYDKLNGVKFRTVKDKQYYTINAKVCDNCYDEVTELINNSPHRRRM
tara:strand:- start:377 stop:631 length:255 start_codon:yes stop_codon:yes gene_type:complete